MSLLCHFWLQPKQRAVSSTTNPGYHRYRTNVRYVDRLFCSIIHLIIMNNKNEKILYIIDPPDYDWESFEPLLSQIQDHFHRILSLWKISTPSGEKVIIKLTVDISNPEKISAYAKQSREDSCTYEVTINAGLSYRLWIASRIFSFSECNMLPWIDKCKINDARIENQSIGGIIADYAYSLSVYYVLFHEISHVILGHLDYLNENMNLDYLSEFQDEKEEYSSQEIIVRKAFEAEADRQAGELLIVIFEQSLGVDGLGGYLLFPSRIHAYEFYIYAITTVFRMFQDLTQRKGVIHPKPNERLQTILSALSNHLKKKHPDEHDEICIYIFQLFVEASDKLFIVGSSDPLNVIRNAFNLSFVDDVIDKTNIRNYQHEVELITG
jgi:hypothetical protein